MIKMTNIYSKGETISMALKIKRLQTLGVPFELSIVKGIGNENVVNLTWDETKYEEALNAEEEF